MKEFITFRYMTKFACITDRCEDHCCADWTIHVNHQQYDRLKKVMEKNGEGAMAQNNLTRDEGDSLFRTVMDDNNVCRFLMPSALCHIHGKYGEKFLPDTCAFYPRAVADNRGAWELSGALSCPEIARLLLLDESAADIVQSGISILPERTAVFIERLAKDDAEPYKARLDEVRQAMLAIMSIPDLSFRSRLFVVAYMADKISGFYHQDCAGNALTQLDDQLEKFADTEFIAELVKEFAQIDVAPGRGVELVQSILIARSALGRSRLKNLFFDIWRAIVKRKTGNDDEPDDADLNLSPAEIIGVYQEAKSALEKRYAKRIDLYFTNYVKNHFVKTWFTSDKNLSAYIQKLVIQISIIRFLIYAHPESAKTYEGDDKKDRLDKIAVESFQKFSKAIEHSDQFIKYIEGEVKKKNLPGFAFTTYEILF